MKSKKFAEIAYKQFGFLRSKYNFKLVACNEEYWGYEIIYRNTTTGVKIIYSFQEAYISIVLYKLVNGALIKNPEPIQKDSILYCHALDDIISHRWPVIYQYGEESRYHDKRNGLTYYVTAFSENLKYNASDVLRGDFTIFNKMDEMVKKRIMLEGD